jgi:hypothetical protein
VVEQARDVGSRGLRECSTLQWKLFAYHSKAYSINRVQMRDKWQVDGMQHMVNLVPPGDYAALAPGLLYTIGQLEHAYLCIVPKDPGPVGQSTLYKDCNSAPAPVRPGYHAIVGVHLAPAIS